MTVPDNAQDRITELETKYTLLQQDFDALNETVLMNVSKLDRLTGMLAELNDKIESAKDEPPRSLEDEKPPHY